MEEWKKYKIGELCSISSSKRIFAKEYQSSGVPFFRGKEIIEKQKGESISTELYISRSRYDEIKIKYGVPKEGDMLLTSVGTLGIPYIVKNENFYFKDGNLTWFSDFKGLNSKFLYYWFLSPIAKNSIEAKAIGSTQKALTIDALSKFEINIPDIDIQNRIASVLSFIDDKIELNRRVNDNLEQQAQALFNEMFPHITEGENMIGDLIIPKRGKGLLSKNAIKGDIPVVAGGIEPATYHNQANTTAPVLTIAASGANAGYINLWHIPVWASDSSYIDDSITPNVYFWYIMLKKRQKEIFDAQVGSAQPHIYPKHIAELPMNVVFVEKIAEYNKIVTPIFEKKGQLFLESKRLTSLRDTLLPKLMSGELKINDINN